MRRRDLTVAIGTLAVLAGACRTAPPRHQSSHEAIAPASPPTPLVLAEGEGERRVRRAQSTGLATPFVLKVDARNGGSSDLVMGYEDIPPGSGISPHQHLVADEIIFVHRGTGIVELGARATPFGPGATIYIPKHTRVAVRNTGTEALAIAFIFSRPGFEAYLRATSVPEGQTAAPLSVDERRAIRAQHAWHTVYEQP